MVQEHRFILKMKDCILFARGCPVPGCVSPRRPSGMCLVVMRPVNGSSASATQCLILEVIWLLKWQKPVVSCSGDSRVRGFSGENPQNTDFRNFLFLDVTVSLVSFGLHPVRGRRRGQRGRAKVDSHDPRTQLGSFYWLWSWRLNPPAPRFLVFSLSWTREFQDEKCSRSC